MKIPNKMKYKQNLVCLCVDDATGQDVQGRIFHGYSEKEIAFHTIIEVLGELEKLFEEIRYPQATVHIRKFVGTQTYDKADKAERVMTNEEILCRRGVLGTFLLTVDSRQNASWQGEIYWMESEETHMFDSEMELFSFIYSALN